jgi:predicted nucleic acid-binding protein
MKLVLDASAAIEAAVGPAKPLVDRVINEAEIVIAPDLFIAEVANGLWKHVVLRGLSVETAVAFLRTASNLINEYRRVATLAEEALREATMHRHPVYDLYYAVLARREGAAILTFDNRLKQLCTKMGVPVADA